LSSTIRSSHLRKAIFTQHADSPSHPSATPTGADTSFHKLTPARCCSLRGAECDDHLDKTVGFADWSFGTLPCATANHPTPNWDQGRTVQFTTRVGFADLVALAQSDGVATRPRLRSMPDEIRRPCAWCFCSRSTCFVVVSTAHKRTHPPPPPHPTPPPRRRSNPATATACGVNKETVSRWRR